MVSYLISFCSTRIRNGNSLNSLPLSAPLSGAIFPSSCVSGAAGHARLLGSKVPGKLPEVPALEKMYRKWFAGKSDVWRLCSDIVDIMDGRSWPIAQKKKVHTIQQTTLK